VSEKSDKSNITSIYSTIQFEKCHLSGKFWVIYDASIFEGCGFDSRRNRLPATLEKGAFTICALLGLFCK